MYSVKVENKNDMLQIDFDNNETFVLTWNQEEVDPEKFFLVTRNNNQNDHAYNVTFCNDTRIDRTVKVSTIHALYRLFSMYSSGELS